MDHIILIGFMGAGKTTIGKKLARRLGRGFADSDQIVEEQEGRPISEIFAKDGEPYFRAAETKALESLAANPEPLVIAAGGGLAVQPANLPILRSMGKTVYLPAETDTLLMRLSSDTKRPLLQGGDLREKIEGLKAAREGAYLAAADFSVATDRRSYRSILDEIVEKCQ